MKANDICFVRECISDGYGVEDICVMSMLTLDEIRKEVSEMREVGTFAAMFQNTTVRRMARMAREGLGE